MTSPTPSERSGAVHRVVVDTNVWVSGLIRPSGPPGLVLRAVRERRLVLVTSWALAEEIAETLRRPKLARYRLSEEAIEDALLLLEPFLPIVDVTAPLRDPDDAPVVVAAIEGDADIIVSGDVDLVEDEQLRAWLGARRVQVLRRSSS